MRNGLFTLIIFSFISIVAFAQKEASYWYFGYKAGIHFSGGTATAITNGKLSAIEGCASICGVAGNLKFYTNGDTVWNRNHQIMDKGLWGSYSSAQSCIIIPVPCDSNMFYIFQSDGQTSGPKHNRAFSYSIVNMTGNGGLGAVVTKNTVLFTPVQETVAAVKHANGIDTWVMTHEDLTNRFVAYLVTAAGISAPVYSSVGGIQSHLTTGVGPIKFSPNGKRVGIMLTKFNMNVFDFNSTTGAVTNPRDLGNGSGSYGFSFSPNSDILYVSGQGNFKLLQYDLLAGGGTAAAIIASMQAIYPAGNPTSNQFYGISLQNGIDGKTYLCHDYWLHANYVGVINNPNILGVGCNYVSDGLDLGGPKKKENCFPNFIESYFMPGYKSPPANGFSVSAGNDTSICPGQPVNLSATPGGSGYSYTWTPAGTLNNPNISSPAANPTVTTTYKVTIIDPNGCIGKDSVTVNIGNALVIDAGKETSICSGGITQLAATAGTGYIYSWQPSGTLDNATIVNPQASPSVTTTYTVTITDPNGCTGIDSVKVNVSNTIVANAGADVTICTGDKTTLQATGGSSYSWTPITSLSNALIPNPDANPTITTTYVVTVSSPNCPSVKDSVKVTVAPNIQAVTGGDKSICNGDTIQLSASGGSTYTWSPSVSLNDPNSATPKASPSSTTKYMVIVKSGTCKADTGYVTVTIVPNIIASVSPDTVLCSGQAVQLTATGGSTYSWGPKTGLSDSTISNPIATPSITTTYTVTVKSGNCAPATNTVTLVVNPSVTVDAGKDITICKGDTTNLSASFSSPNITWFKWSTGDSTNNLSVSPQTSTSYYAVVYSNKQCPPDSDFVNVNVLSASTNLPDTFSILKGDSVTMSNLSSGSYSWTPSNNLSCTNCPSPTANPTVTTTYYVTYVDTNGCKVSDTVVVSVIEKCSDIFIPTAFSPNGDGANDVFYVRSECIKSMKLTIFNRWGEKVFESDKASDGWDGSYKGTMQNAAVFDYNIDAIMTDGTEVSKKGNITLVR